MPQTPEAQAFLTRVAEVSSGAAAFDALSHALQPSLDDEAELRKLFATDKANSRLNDLYVGLVDVFDAPPTVRTTYARVVKDEADLSAKHVLPLLDEGRRKDGTPATSESMDEFRRNWAIFTEGALSQLGDWSNIVAAGGAVQACLNPVPGSATVSKRALRKHFHTQAYPTSDVDLFLYGLTPTQAEAKIVAVYEAVRDSVPWDVTCVRTKHTVSIHSQYPYRAVQIVLRLYSSPAEILAGFDVDAPCCAYDGTRVWASPRALVAMMRQCNTVDITRRSPSYEVRLAKYSIRNFEVYVPTLKREDIDPTIFERAITRIEGLARLLVIEKLMDAETRQRYLTDRRTLRGRADQNNYYQARRGKRKYKGDLKDNLDIGGLELNDYDVVALHIPYGLGWDARRIEKLIYQTDLGMNSPFNPKNENRRLHRHPAYFGTMEECLEDCCEFCPEPKNDEEKELQEEEDKSYIRGRVQFMQEDPGRQSISGSFHPIDDGEWAGQAYMGPTEKLFAAIVANDRAAVAGVISQEGFDLERRDHVGRTPLQIAILSKAEDIACDLIAAGARMTSRIVDGRSSLHLAAQLDLPLVVRKLLERSDVNAESVMQAEAEAERAKQAEMESQKAEKAADPQDDMEVDLEAESDEVDSDDDDEGRSSDDDWLSDEDGAKEEKKDAAEKASPNKDQIPEDEEDTPDVIDIDAPDWDATLTPLQYAVIYGSLGAVDELIAAGADVKLVTHRTTGYNAPFLHQLTVATLTEKEDVASQMVQKLVAAGAVSSEADENLVTIFLKFVNARKPQLVSALLRFDPNAKAVIDTPFVPQWGRMIFPTVCALMAQDYSTLAVLLAYDAKLALTEEDYSKAHDQRFSGQVFRHNNVLQWRQNLPLPLEVAIANFDEAVDLLASLGADASALTIEAVSRSFKYNLLNWTRWIIRAVTTYQDQHKRDTSPSQWAAISEKPESVNFLGSGGLFGIPTPTGVTPDTPGWKGEYCRVLLKYRDVCIANGNSQPLAWYHNSFQVDSQAKQAWIAEAKAYWEATEKVLVAHGVKEEEKPADGSYEPAAAGPAQNSGAELAHLKGMQLFYHRLSGSFSSTVAPTHLTPLYDQLFEACAAGDNAKIQQLCLQKPSTKSTDDLLQVAAKYGHSWNPLSLAVQNRHWNSARLVLAIASAQHQPAKSKPAAFQTHNIVLDGDNGSDNASDEDEDDAMEIEEMDFVDIAKRPSTVTTLASPDDLLNIAVHFDGKDSKTGHLATVLRKSILEDDFEAFVQITELYKTLAQPRPLPGDTFTYILQCDRPNMLDEYIRRTGQGFNLAEPEDEDDVSAQSKHLKDSKSNMYFGLNVHGKKRKDLALKNDPNAQAPSVQNTVPVLWDAIKYGALNVIKYLSGDRPLAAYQYYASANSDERARYIRKSTDLAVVLPRWLGWTSNPLKESPLTVAVAANKLEVLQALLALKRPELNNMLSVRINYLSFNHIQVVASSDNCSVEMFEFLRSKGISPTETDHRGWNILHWLVFRGGEQDMKLLEHVLKTLQKDIVENMLKHQSKDCMNTPLHIAVKKNRLDLVRILVSANAPTTILRDTLGSTVLHVAVRNTLPEITKIIAEACPIEALHMEDAVGNTPLEIITQARLLAQTGSNFCNNIDKSSALSVYSAIEHSVNKKPFNIAHHEKEVPKLRATINALIAEGRLRNGTKVATELLAFAGKIEAKLAIEKGKAAAALKAPESESAKPTVWAPLSDRKSTEDTLKNLLAVITARPAAQPRYLVHLIDVQRSVKSCLDGAKVIPWNPKPVEDELDPEVKVNKEQQEKNGSFLASWSNDVFGKDNLRI